MLRYKACRNSIVTLELLNDSVTNEKRDVVNDKYAKFRCDKSIVIGITNVKTGEKMVEDVSIRDNKFIYNVGKIVETCFDEDLNRVCGKGIHYFKTEDAAMVWFYNQNENFPDGKIISWHENGQKYCEGTYKDGERDGKWIWWWGNGNKESEGTYKDGIKDGKWTECYGNGQKKSEGTYKNEELVNNNGQKKCDINGKEDGKWIQWWDNGQKKTEGTYKDGKHHGEWIYWDILGNKME